MARKYLAGYDSPSVRGDMAVILGEVAKKQLSNLPVDSASLTVSCVLQET